MNKRKILLLSLISSLITTGFISLGASLIAGKDVYLHVANSRIFQINFIGGPILFSICFLIYMKLFKRVRPKTDDMPGRMIRSADLMHRMTKFAARWKYITLTIAIICAIPVLIITYRARKIQLAIVQLKVDNPQVNNWGQSHIRTRDFNDDSWSNSKDPIYLSHIDKFIDVVYLDGLLFDSLILYFGSPYISDISALKGLPIKSLDLNYCSLNELTVLKDMPLVYISLPHTTKNIDSLRSVKTLKNINNDTAEDFWKLHDIMKEPLEQLLKDNPQVKDWYLLESKYNDGIDLDLLISDLADISALEGLPIKKLFLTGTKVSNISALKGMPLEKLVLANTLVKDISPLKGIKLKTLYLNSTPV
ncbi:MAG: hypothetical protein HRT89_21300, partial [Lentisphaeria bacterium]|nr:hypothetical protein [Lentisphaeria bacterium]